MSIRKAKNKTGVEGNTALHNEIRTSLLPVSSINIADLFKNVNIKDAKFLKYAPNQFLNEKQIKAKEMELATDSAKYSIKRYSFSADNTSPTSNPNRRYSFSTDERNNERKEILQQLSDGRITVEEAEKLLAPKKKTALKKIKDITDMTAEDMLTTPTITRRKGTSNGDSAISKIKAVDGSYAIQIAPNESKQSAREIIGKSGTHYGVGVYLDSQKLDGLSKEERIAKVVEHIENLGGYPFSDFDNDGNKVKIKIAPKTKYKNEKGNPERANRHLTNYLDNEIKQEALMLIAEVIGAANFKGKEPATHPHGWLDNSGRNEW